MNLYPERIEVEGGQKIVLHHTPGVTSFASASDGVCRGLFAQNGRCFAVLGPTLYEVLSDGTMTSRGTLVVDQYPATMQTNGDGGDELFITSGDEGYILTLSTNVLTSEVSDVTMGGMINGYFVALDINSSTFKISDSLDGKTWDGTQILQRSTAADPWKSMLVKYPVVFLFGEETSEPLYDAGTFPFPFAPAQGVLIPYGTVAPFSPQSLGNAVLWLTRTKDGDRQVVAMQGYSARRVSTHAVEFAMSQYTRVDDAVAFTYQDQGHEFYELNFPAAKATWVYDLTTGLWHERGFWNSTDGEYLAWGPQYHAQAFGHHLVGDHTSGTIYRMAVDIYTDTDGAGLRRQRIPPALTADQKRVYLDWFQLHVDVGLGLSAGQGSNPEVMLQMSYDGGVTWGSERWRSAGKIGEYGHRAQWWRCGSGRNVIPSVTMTDPIPWRITDAYIKASPGAF
jgi:hypothetical protein